MAEDGDAAVGDTRSGGGDEERGAQQVSELGRVGSERDRQRQRSIYVGSDSVFHMLYQPMGDYTWSK